MIKRLTLILTPVLLLLPSLNVTAQTQFDECGWMQRSEYSNDEPLTKQEIIELREQEITQLANQSEHCLSQGRGGGAQGSSGSGAGSGGSGNANGQEGSTGSSGKGTGADSASSAGAPDSDSQSASKDKGEGKNSQSGSMQASSNHLSEGESSASSSSIAKGTFVAPQTPESATESDASNNSPASTTTDQTYQGTGNGAPRVSTKSADNKERLRQQLRDAIAATDDPEVKKKLQERLDGLK
jgi:hypothetical protein